MGTNLALAGELMYGSFRRAPPKLKIICYKDTKEKDQMIISHMGCFCRTEVKLEQCNNNIPHQWDINNLS